MKKVLFSFILILIIGFTIGCDDNKEIISKASYFNGMVVVDGRVISKTIINAEEVCFSLRFYETGKYKISYSQLGWTKEKFYNLFEDAIKTVPCEIIINKRDQFDKQTKIMVTNISKGNKSEIHEFNLE